MIEIAVVIGLFAILVALGLLMSMDVWRGSSFGSEQDIVVSLMHKARSRAVSNINEHDHGLEIDMVNEEYILFEVDDDGTTHINESPFEMSSGFEFPDDTQVVFAARTGSTSGYSLTIEGQGKTRTFDINSEGGVTW